MPAEDNSKMLPAEVAYELSNVSCTALAGDRQHGQPLKIRMRSFGQQANFDDVRLDASPVPEPATWVLALFGTLAATGIGRRKV